MKTQKISDYDQIKVMLNKIRNLNENKVTKSNFILEQNSSDSYNDGSDNEKNDTNTESVKKQYDNIEVINDVEVKLLSTDREDTEVKPEEKETISQIIDSFRSEVSQISELDPGFTITETQVRLDGTDDETGVNFTFVVGEDMGIYITSEMMTVNEKTIEFITKLANFFKTYTSAMEPLVRTRKNT
jgi:hypothetical protein